MKPFRIFIAIITGLIMANCATPVAPTGGPKDEIPPNIVSATPPNYSTNFSAKEISIEFNEWVAIKDIYKELLISPPLNQRPEFKIKKKSLVFKIEEELLENTTYTFFLGNSIADITENNAFKNLEYVFSTGNYLDSLMIKGQVMDAITGEAVENASVMLYTTDRKESVNIDSLPYNSRPTYVAKTDKSGNFELSNLRDIPFLIFVLKDQNANYLYDLPNEEIAFSDSLVLAYPDAKIPDKMVVDSITNDTTYVKAPQSAPIDLFLFKAQDSIQKIVSVEIPRDKNIQIILAKEASSYSFEAIDFKPDFNFLIEEPNKTNDTLNFWLKGMLPDSLGFLFTVDDQFLDTLYFVINEPEIAEDSRRRAKKPKVETKKVARIKSNVYNHLIGYKEPLKLEFDYPLEEYDFSKFVWMEDSIISIPQIEFADSSYRRINISTEFDELKEYELVIPDSCLFNIVHKTYDSTYFRFKTRKVDDYGKLFLTLDTEYDCQLIIQLTNENGVVLEERIASKGETLIYDQLLPSKYKLQAIIDLNNNGKWDTGSYSAKRQAEKISLYKQVLELRANWEMEETWRIN